MREFEELIDEALQDVREAEPPPNMEARVMARVATEQAHGLRWRLIGGLVAAGLTLAVLFVSNKPVKQLPGVAVSHGTTQSLEVPSQFKGNLPVQDVAEYRVPHRRLSRVGVHPRSKLSHGASLQIVPIQIEPLWMKAMEIASLTSRNRNETGETQ